MTQLATYVILNARTPFFSEQRSFLRKTWLVSCHFRHEEPQELTAYATKWQLGSSIEKRAEVTALQRSAM